MFTNTTVSLTNRGPYLGLSVGLCSVSLVVVVCIAHSTNKLKIAINKTQAETEIITVKQKRQESPKRIFHFYKYRYYHYNNALRICTSITVETKYFLIYCCCCCSPLIPLRFSQEIVNGGTANILLFIFYSNWYRNQIICSNIDLQRQEVAQIHSMATGFPVPPAFDIL